MPAFTSFSNSARVRFCLPILIPLLLGACAMNPVSLDHVSAGDSARLLDGSELPGFSGTLTLPDDPVLELTPEMKEYIHRMMDVTGRYHFAPKELAGVLLHPGSLGIEYSSEATYTARETFRKRQANCLAFTILVVAFAREMGMHARFNEVDVPPIWDLQDPSTLVLYKHVNALVRSDVGPRMVVDIDLDEYDQSFRQREIRDNMAVAQYYNNRAMEFLGKADYTNALRYLAKALTLEPGISYMWANLGSLYRRAGNLQAAERAYRVALQKNPGDLVAISNAARLYERLGRTALAHELAERAEYFRMQNPYYRYRLALDALGTGNYAKALEQVDAAIKLYSREHRFYFLQGVVYRQMGRTELAEQSVNRAIKLASDAAQGARYRHKMDMLLSAAGAPRAYMN